MRPFFKALTDRGALDGGWRKCAVGMTRGRITIDRGDRLIVIQMGVKLSSNALYVRREKVRFDGQRAEQSRAERVDRQGRADRTVQKSGLGCLARLPNLNNAHAARNAR